MKRVMNLPSSTPAVLTRVELGRFAVHWLTPAVLTRVEVGRLAARA